MLQALQKSSSNTKAIPCPINYVDRGMCWKNRVSADTPSLICVSDRATTECFETNAFTFAIFSDQWRELCTDKNCIFQKAQEGRGQTLESAMPTASPLAPEEPWG